jgi:hypothetical protein
MRSNRLWRRSGGIREAGSGRARLIIVHVLRLSAARQECRLEHADTFRVSLQAIVVLVMIEAVVRRVVQALVGVEQRPFFGEQGKPLRFQLRGRHGALSLRQRADLRAELALVSWFGRKRS